MRLSRVLLDELLRLYYLTAEVDIGTSGVENFSLADLRRLVGFSYGEIDRLTLCDSNSFGGPGVRQAFVDRWLGGRADSALVTHGSSEPLDLIMAPLLAPRDEVVVLDPCYPQHASITGALGCRIRCWSLRFRPDLAELRGLLGPRTRMVVTHFPHNPTGTPEDREELLRLTAEAGLYLVWNGAFSALTYEVPPLPEPPLDSDRVLWIGTLSKAYGLPGLRVGWCLGAPPFSSGWSRPASMSSSICHARVIRRSERLIVPRLPQARRTGSCSPSGSRATLGWSSGFPPQGASAPSSTLLRCRMSTPSAIASPESTASSWSTAPAWATPAKRASDLVAGPTPSKPASPGFPTSCAPPVRSRRAGAQSHF